MRLSVLPDSFGSVTPTVAEGRHFDQSLGMMVPEGYDAEANCRWAERNKVTTDDLAKSAFAIVTRRSIRMSGSPLFEKVGSGGAWDYKRASRDLADVGNYNFGYAAFCAGLSLVEAKTAGGIYQIKSGTSKISWYPWFDDPADTARIEQGYLDAQNRAGIAPVFDWVDRLTLDSLKPENRTVVPLQDTMNFGIDVKDEPSTLRLP
jgi:hypothetical protein